MPLKSINQIFFIELFYTSTLILLMKYEHCQVFLFNINKHHQNSSCLYLLNVFNHWAISPATMNLSFFIGQIYCFLFQNIQHGYRCFQNRLMQGVSPPARTSLTDEAAHANVLKTSKKKLEYFTGGQTGDVKCLPLSSVCCLPCQWDLTDAAVSPEKIW